jgi:hypothetical protein
MRQTQIEIVDKVFVVVRGKRKCLICDCIFAPKQAENHARTPSAATMRKRRGYG